MKLIKATQNSLIGLCLAFTLNACAGDDAAMEDGVENSENEEAADVEGAENNVENANFANEGGENENFGNENMGNENMGNNMGNENFGNENMGNNENNLGNNENNMGNNMAEENFGNEEGGNAVEGAEASANEFVNNAAGEDFLGTNSGNVAAEVPAADPTADAALAENSSEDLGIAPSDGIVEANQNAVQETENLSDPNMGATDASLAAPAPAAPVAGGRVHYVTRSGASAYDQPSGQVVKSYEQGDHPLVTADGEWAQTSDGTYIQKSDITTKPVPRAKSPKAWR